MSDLDERRARLMYCMDYLIHALNDEEAMSGWLTNFIPDGTMDAGSELADDQVRGFMDMGVTQREFDDMVAEFVSTLFVETFPAVYRIMCRNGVSFTPHEGKVLV